MRPAFLTVLCILTFLWNSVKIYSGVNNYMEAEAMSQNMGPILEQVQEKMAESYTEEQQAEAEKMMVAMKEQLTATNIKTSSIALLISAILLILGGIWMWDLKKKGFWVYIAGNMVGIIAPLIIFGGVIGTSVAFMCSILAAICIGLYAINLKSLV